MPPESSRRTSVRGGRPPREPGHPSREPGHPSPPPVRGRVPDGQPSRAGSGFPIGRAILPLRLFLGVTFVIAGMDKITDPAFLQASGPGSIGQQLVGFTRTSPLTPLIEAVALPFPVAIGWLMALAELAIGVATVLGVATRLAAVGGAAIAVLFWLTASWATTPYYYGPDLPYAAGWLTLALIGDGGLLVLGPVLLGVLNGPVATDGRYGRRDAPADETRRRLVGAGILAGAAVVVAGIGATLSAFLRSPGESEAAGRGLTPSAGSSGQVALGATPAPPAIIVGHRPTAAPTTAPRGAPIASVGQFASSRSLAFSDPTTGDPAVLVKLSSSAFAAFDAICTHAGCTVQYDDPSGLLICPCHGAEFDPKAHAAVVAGPTQTPLAELPIAISNGTVYLTG